MLQEIERKFKVKNDAYKALATQKMRLTQGYLSSVPERTVRIRLKGDEAFITVKGKTNEAGTTRFEWEKPISVAEAQQLLALCESGIIDKTRYLATQGTTMQCSPITLTKNGTKNCQSKIISYFCKNNHQMATLANRQIDKLVLWQEIFYQLPY